MSYITRYALTESDIFKRKLQVALWIAAVDVTNEDVNTANHAARNQWANKMLRGFADADVIRKVAIRASANATIGALGENADDIDIQFVVSGLVDELS